MLGVTKLKIASLNFYKPIFSVITFLAFVFNCFGSPPYLHTLFLSELLFLPSTLLTLVAQVGKLETEDQKRLDTYTAVLMYVLIGLVVCTLFMYDLRIDALSYLWALTIRVIFCFFNGWCTILAVRYVGLEKTIDIEQAIKYTATRDNEALKKLKADEVADKFIAKDKQKEQFDKFVSDAIRRRQGGHRS